MSLPDSIRCNLSLYNLFEGMLLLSIKLKPFCLQKLRKDSFASIIILKLIFSVTTNDEMIISFTPLSLQFWAIVTHRVF